jgi:hypothetical protein
MSNTSGEPNAWTTAAVVVLCLVSALLFLALPAETLIVDLVYQGF